MAEGAGAQSARNADDGDGLGRGGLRARSSAETVRPSLNLYGVTGLIDMPSAQTQPDAQVSLSYSYFGETQRRNFTFQILPRVAGTDPLLDDRQLGPARRERRLRPDLRSVRPQLRPPVHAAAGRRVAAVDAGVALGFRDFLGTGVYSSEYLVATKTVQVLHADRAALAGAGCRGPTTFENPFCAIASDACRPRQRLRRGRQGLDRHVLSRPERRRVRRRRVASPIDGLSFKAEYSTDDYKREQQSPASTFAPKSAVQLRRGIPRPRGHHGRRLLHVRLGRSGSTSRSAPTRCVRWCRPTSAPGRCRSTRARRTRRMGTGWATNPAARDQLAVALEEILRAEGMQLDGFSADPDGRGVEVAITNLRFQSDPKAVGRTTRVLAAGLPASVETFRITMVQDDLRTSTIIIDRTDFEKRGRPAECRRGKLGQSPDRRRYAVRCRRTAGCPTPTPTSTGASCRRRS